MFYPDHIRLFAKLFFKEFPRDAGFPDRHTVQSIDAFIDEANWKHSNSPCFLNLYNKSLGFLWIDIDGKQWEQQNVFLSIKKTYFKTFSDELKINLNDIVLVYTGEKGYHYYIQNKPTRIPSNGNSLLEFKGQLKNTLLYITRNLVQADSPLFTDTNRMTRVPGIKRPEGSLCIAINPQELFKFDSFYEYLSFYDFQWSNIIKHNNSWLKTIKPTKRNYLTEIKQKIIEENWKPRKPRKPISKQELSQVIENKEGYAEAVDRILKITLSAETYIGIHIHNPLNSVRITYALALLHKGFTVEDIVSFSSTLQWFDFDPDITRDRVQYCKDKYIDQTR